MRWEFLAEGEHKMTLVHRSGFLEGYTYIEVGLFVPTIAVVLLVTMIVRILNVCPVDRARGPSKWDLQD